ncbi:MAG: hypothetical protein AAF927_22730 [Bacteroidota bacterium]
MHRKLLQKSIFVWLFSLLIFSGVEARPFALPFDGEDTPGETPDAAVIRVRGRILETHSGQPLKKASVIIKIGDKIVASRLTSKDGFFSIDIPRHLATAEDLDISIEFMDHVFLQKDLKLASQDILVRINGEILLDDDPIADYKLPIHTLGNPKVGSVEVRLRQLTPKSVKIPGDGEV